MSFFLRLPGGDPVVIWCPSSAQSIDVDEDIQLFLRCNRRPENEWARVSGNVSVISPQFWCAGDEVGADAADGSLPAGTVVMTGCRRSSTGSFRTLRAETAPVLVKEGSDHFRDSQQRRPSRAETVTGLRRQLPKPPAFAGASRHLPPPPAFAGASKAATAASPGRPRPPLPVPQANGGAAGAPPGFFFAAPPPLPAAGEPNRPTPPPLPAAPAPAGWSSDDDDSEEDFEEGAAAAGGGWAPAVDEASGDTYYYNQATGELFVRLSL